ncbi:MAG: hypothetical protein L6R41_000386 [Letrouitia leprolyta]|nr:MAG: hypothetical protein L6R41_000386 [Letrouitia leprolyta]
MMRRFLERVSASIERQITAAGTSSATSSSDTNYIHDYESGDEVPWDDGGSEVSIQVTGCNNLRYEPLDHTIAEFRVLILDPAVDRRAPINCHLKCVPFNGNATGQLSYEALSYTWGDPTGQRVIYVNGSPCLITKNLDIALRYLRKRYGYRVLWVDSVCINQQDKSEKTYQIKMMKEIYREASQVLVWLGESDKDIRMAMDCIKRLEAPGYLDPNQVASFYAPCEAGLDKLFRKPWWSRLWVVQEVLMARNPPMVGCGRKWVSWTAFQKALMNLALNKTDRDNFLQNPNAKLNFGIMPTPYSTHNPEQRLWWQQLEVVLNATSDRDATEPHDKIFALLGLMKPSTAARIVVDYDQPCSILYQTVTVCVIESAPTVDFLFHATKHKRLNLPSWCVDFSQVNWNQFSYGQGWTIFCKTDFHASGQLPKSTITHSVYRGTCEVIGALLGRIQHVVASNLDPVGLERFRNVLKDMINFTIAAKPGLEARLGKQMTHDKLATANLWKSFMNPGESLYTNPDNLSAFQRLVMPMQHTAMQMMARADDSLVKTVAEEWSLSGHAFPSSWDLQHWAANALYYSGSRIDDEVFLATNTGYLGMTPRPCKEILEGDLLVIIHGCSVPVVLRPKEHMFELVAWIYVPDVMQGEFLNTPGRYTYKFPLC